MVPLNNNKRDIAKRFILFALSLLLFGMAFGLLGTLQYLIPGLAKNYISFEKTRPLHVSSVIFWILFAAIGSVLSYVQAYRKTQIAFPILLKLQWGLFAGTTILIILSYFTGKFGGREYWEFDPIFFLPILLGWIFFIINFIATIGTFKNQPVYVWMWATGCFFFLFTFIESYLWVFP